MVNEWKYVSFDVTSSSWITGIYFMLLTYEHYIILQKNIVISVGPTGQSSALFHPNGHVYQHGSRVEILAYDCRGNNK
jgi:hypothetical protein